jgi:hypothetical protein
VPLDKESSYKEVFLSSTPAAKREFTLRVSATLTFLVIQSRSFATKMEQSHCVIAHPGIFLLR